jgi:protein-disulfide isomerase
MQKSDRALLITGIVVALLVLGIIFLPGMLSGNTINPNSSLLSQGNSPIIGNENAQVTIYEFTDFSCPFCQDFATQTLPQIEQNYINSGKVKIVFKYYPGHGQAQSAHVVALALYDLSPALFVKFHNYVFANPQDLDSLTKMKDLAVFLGADRTQLENMMKNKDYFAELKADEAMAKQVGISGTPSFVIGNKLIEGAKPYSSFDSVIKSALG